MGEGEEYELLELFEAYDELSVAQIAEKLEWEEELARRCTSELEKKGLVNMRDGKVCVNKEVGIGDMLNMDEIDPRVLKEFSVH